MEDILRAKTVVELKALCKELGLRGYSNLNEDDLIEKIIDSGKYSIESDEVEETEESDEVEETTIRKFKKLVKNPLNIGGFKVGKDEYTFSVDTLELSERALKKLNNSIGTLIEEI